MINIKVYATSPILYSLFFVNAYLREFKIEKKQIVYLYNTAVLIIGIFLYPNKEGYSINLGIMMTLIFIVFGLVWIFYEFQNANQIGITDKQFFWVSVSLLLWAVFFLFRLVPMYLFEKADDEFLVTLNKIFQWVTIISYIIFLKGLTCKS